MKGNNFGYKFLAVITLVVFLANAAAYNYASPFGSPDPDPDPKPADSAKLRFPIQDRRGDPTADPKNRSIDLNDPSNVRKTVEYDPDSNRFYLSEKVGNEYLRNPTYLSMDEYLKYRAQEDENAYWQQRLNALSLFGGKPKLPTMYREGIFDRIFGGAGINVRPQGNVDITMGVNSQNIKNPALTQRAQKYSVFDFDMQMNVNLLATIGDKMKLNISNNTKATFDYQNVQKLEYTGKEDEIIKKIELGNVSFPLKSTLIQGVQSIFGVKTQLQFGKLWITSAIAQQRSKKNSLTIQGQGQTQQFAIKADDYEENKNFLLGQTFRNNYNTALKNFPVINSQYNINKIQVWVTNRTGAIENIRDMMGFMDLGEKTPYRQALINGSGSVQPDNRSNSLYDQLLQNPNGRQQANAENAARMLGLQQSVDWEHITVRKLLPSDYTFNPVLGYISVNTTLNPDDVLAVAYRYTYNGKVYQVGEFAEDLPPDSTNQKVIYLKLLKGTSARPRLPIWDLMMKNMYPLGGYGISREDFRLNVFYQDPGGGEKRYLPEGPAAGTQLLTLLNLDRLNAQNDPMPDGIFDYYEGITINPQQGKIIFPVLEPFGSDLSPALGNNPALDRKYLYSILYDSTKTIARQFQQNNRFVLRGSYKSSSSGDVQLGFNIPQGSVVVTAGGQRLVEGVDYQVDYNLGRLRILNTGILSSGIPINVQFEDNATFGFQQQNFMGTRLDYFLNNKVTLGGTYMRLTERPFTQKTTFGDDPIKNTALGLDANYQSEAPGLTRLLDKLPIYATTASSYVTASGEVATLRPGHPQQINSLDPEGAVYIDDFEGTRSAYDLRYPSNAWTLSSTPSGAFGPGGNLLFPEATDDKTLSYGQNRAKLAWYYIEPTLVDPAGGIPGYVKQDPAQHYVRLVQQLDVFPSKSTGTLQNALSTFDLGFYPKERGPYNFDTRNVDANGRFTNPTNRWGGIMRPIEYSDFEASNVEFIEFWMLDPFINNPNNNGSLYLNLGNVSEDVLKDNLKFFENGISNPKDQTKLSKSQWGYQPLFQQQVTRSFDNDPAARATQDVGYDGLSNTEEKQQYGNFLNQIRAVVTNPGVLQELSDDPATDDYLYFKDGKYEQNNTGILSRYKRYNGPEGNSPVTQGGNGIAIGATTIPESEDINRDNTLNTSEDYYQYRVDLKPGMDVGNNYIINKQVSDVKLPNGNTEKETWYQFKIPIQEFAQRVGNISDFRSIRFIRLYMSGFADSTILRFARLELGRNQWRQYLFSLQTPGENIPDIDRRTTNVTVTSVSVEENTNRTPVNYVIPPGVNRQLSAQSGGQTLQQNEQALSLQVCSLKDGDARAVYKEVGVDMRQFGNLRLFIHGESQIGQTPLKDGDLNAIIRVGSDFINNYYEYQVPLKITAPGRNLTAEQVWPEGNMVNLVLNDLVQVKSSRNAKGLPAYVPYQEKDALGNTIVVVGNPNIGDAKTVLLGVSNPKKTRNTPQDDGLAKCVEVWFNEMRMSGINEKPGYAATGRVNVQLADLGTVRASGSMHTIGYGNIDQKIAQRQRDNYYQYDASTNLNLGKLLPRRIGLELPLFVGYTQSISNPQYNPYDLDVKIDDQISAAQSSAQSDSIRKVTQDFTSITSFNLTNIRFRGNPDKPQARKTIFSIQNFDFTYAYNQQYKHNPLIEYDRLTNQRFGFGYAYGIKPRPVEPFRKLIKSRSKWFNLIRDFNFNPLPSNIGFRTELNRIVDETLVRNISDGPYKIAPTYFKNFTWVRNYTLRWELTKSMSFTYNASNFSRIDEPYGLIDTKAKRDTLIDRLLALGRNTLYTQDFNLTYNLPLSKLPLLDWTNLRTSYGSTYTWTAASLLAKSLGNTLTNTQTIQVNGELNFTQLYNKNRYLRAVNQPKPRNVNQPKKPPVSAIAKPVNTDSIKNALKKKPGKDDIVINGITLSAKNYTDRQVDSLRGIQKMQEAARQKADKAARKKARIAARKARRAATPDISAGARIIGRLLTMVKRVTGTYNENAGTVLPGYLDSTTVLGTNNLGSPGLGYAFGFQPASRMQEEFAREGKLSRDSLFNAQFQQTYTQNISLNATLEPFPDLRVDLTISRSFSKAHTEVFKDSSNAGGPFRHLNAYETGSFSVSYIGLKTLFKPTGANTDVYNAFLAYRKDVSERLAARNPYTAGVRDPNDPAYYKGYTAFSQEVLIPAFVAAYSGKKVDKVGLIDNNVKGTRSNPFAGFLPLPNWRISYNGLSRLPIFTPIFNNFVINHAYTGTMSMSSFVSSLLYQDVYALGAPSFIDSSSGNYVPFYQVPNLYIDESFSPLLGIDASFKNNLTARVEFRKTRRVSISLLDYQVSEVRSAELIIGAGYRLHGLNLPFEVFGVRRLKNDINIKADIGYRDDRTSNSYLAQNLEVVSRGQKVLTISPSLDYLVTDKLTLRLFFDRRVSIPYTSPPFPISTTRAGITLRFIFAQ